MKTESLAAEAIALTKAAGKEWGWQDFAEVARLIQEEEQQGSTDTAGSLPALPSKSNKNKQKEHEHNKKTMQT